MISVFEAAFVHALSTLEQVSQAFRMEGCNVALTCCSNLFKTAVLSSLFTIDNNNNNNNIIIIIIIIVIVIVTVMIIYSHF